MSGDDYQIVSTTFFVATSRAIQVQQPKARGGDRIWIPRSLLHGADDLKAEKWREREEVTFRLRKWKAEQEGFA